MVVIILILIFVVGVKGVSFLIITLFLFLIRLLIFYNNGYDGLLVALDIKSGAYGLGGYNSDVYSLSIWLIIISLLY